MADFGNDGQDMKTEGVVATAPARLETSVSRLPPTVRRALCWCAIILAVALLFGLSSLAAWWPR